MSTPTRLTATNAIVPLGTALRVFVERPDVESVCRNIRVDWANGRLTQAPAAARSLLARIGGLQDTDEDALTETGARVLGRLQVDLEDATKRSWLREKFELGETVGRGSSSIAVRAVNRRIKRTVILKVLRPSLPGAAAKAVRSLGALEGIEQLVAPIDLLEWEATSVAGDKLGLHCIVFPFVGATTLEDYLRERPPVTPFFFEALIGQLGGVLGAIEERELSHGDLHGGNILVKTETSRLEFVVIDPSPGLGWESPYGHARTDFEWFKEHVTTSLLSLQRHLASMSLQKHLGPRLFSAIRRIVGAEAMEFADALRLMEPEGDAAYKRWQRHRETFIARQFARPGPLGLLRWEEIANPAEAVELFEPYRPLFRRIRTFGNSLVVGARGSGKSTYLAALAYFPGATARTVEPNDILGVLFSCRQGEFKQFGDELLSAARNEVKHVLVLKIIRRLLRVLSTGCECGELQVADSMAPLYKFAQRYMNEQISIPLVDASPRAAIANLAAGVMRWEEFEIGRLFTAPTKSQDGAKVLLDEAALLVFCRLIREHIPALSTTKFYLLFDDAGEPNIPMGAQQILNDIVTHSNPVYCVKLSAERFSYRLRDSRSRTLEETHDITSFDMASAYATESGVARNAVKDYFKQILRRRLDYWRYDFNDIEAYLGDRQREGGRIIAVKELVARLAERRKNAYYAGWEVVWRVADKTARSLIEIVSEIFEHAGVRPPQEGTGALGAREEATVIEARVQDRAIRAVSNRRLRSLEFVPGEIAVRERKVAIGRQLYDCASSFGSVSFRYLSSGRRRTKRVDEFLAIERNDTKALRGEARRVLELLVRYGVFDDSPLTVAFDDKQKKPVYVLNRILCPAFQISFRRDQHMRLSADKLEMFLLEPEEFAKSGTTFLRAATERSLWDGSGED